MMQVDLAERPMHREPGPRLHYWGRHIHAHKSIIYATKKSYSVQAYIKVLYYVSPLL